MALHSRQVRRGSGCRAGDPGTGGHLCGAARDGGRAVGPVVSEQPVGSGVIQGSVFVALFDGGDVVIGGDIGRRRSVIGADVDRLADGEGITDRRRQDDLVRAGRGRDRVVRVVGHGDRAVHNGLHIGRSELDGHEQPLVVVHHAGLDDRLVGERPVAVGPGGVPEVLVVAEAVVVARQAHRVAVL